MMGHQISVENDIREYWIGPRDPGYTPRDAWFPRQYLYGQTYKIDGEPATREQVDGVVNSEYAREGMMKWSNSRLTNWERMERLCLTVHDLLGPFDGRDPETDGPIDLETSGARIRKAQAVLAEVE
ncbi:unnamed protein product [marine sediment metagenome]|uniref:Uncharacterized protein n=1 Tax=marine sediment metagenome TaxID=412755 RepID=X0V703_9ZZZZ